MPVRHNRLEKKLPKSLSLAEIAGYLSGRSGSGHSVKLFTDFLVKAATPFNPKKISRKHDLIVFCDNGSDVPAEIDRGMADEVYVMRDFFLHFIFCTSRYRYPRIKRSYRKNPFWGDSPPALPFLEK
jgi:hypothetical protein